MGADLVCTVKMRRSLVLLLCVALLLSLLAPEVEGAAIRGRGRRRGGGRVKSYRRNSRRQGGRRIPVQRRKGRTGTAPPPDADVVTDDSGWDDTAKDEGAAGAAGALGDLAGLCEILMFDRGEGTYSLKFIKNDC